ncbi:MAG: nucleotidyltransferase domain-containing protein [Deltaproteobacteria bacterium]|nr:nucleotidyltransferase domain-containing protein [Deltaproteobacteria bacterium]
MDAKIKTVLAEIKASLEAIYGNRFKGVYLFGSYAPGEADTESDLDILVVLDDFNHYAGEIDRTGQLIADLSLEHGISISEVFVKEHQWRHGDTPFLLNVRDEAVPV